MKLANNGAKEWRKYSELSIMLVKSWPKNFNFKCSCRTMAQKNGGNRLIVEKQKPAGEIANQQAGYEKRQNDSNSSSIDKTTEEKYHEHRTQRLFNFKRMVPPKFAIIYHVLHLKKAKFGGAGF